MTHGKGRSNRNNDGGALLWAAVGLVALAALMRLVPHPWNFTPVGAMALFGGAALRRPVFALGVPLAAMALSDLILGWMGQAQTMAVWVYASFALVGLLGLVLRRRHAPRRIAAASLAGSVIFFSVTNLGVWVSGSVGYPMTFEGLAACYAAAVPFFVSTVAGDLFWNAVLFGTFVLVGRRLQDPATASTA